MKDIMLLSIYLSKVLDAENIKTETIYSHIVDYIVGKADVDIVNDDELLRSNYFKYYFKRQGMGKQIIDEAVGEVD